MAKKNKRRNKRGNKKSKRYNQSHAEKRIHICKNRVMRTFDVLCKMRKAKTTRHDCLLCQKVKNVNNHSRIV
ncbi:MAG: hypothetical protein FWC41_08935 [Firmicutes bacterium]|nr:hypothetical protein [Bacillota bacterium]